MYQLCVSKYRYETDTSCTLFNKPPNTFYVYEEYGIIGNCYISCATCSDLGNVDDNKCDTCREPYFMEKDENGNDNGMCSQCHINCESCNKGGNDVSNNCLMCKDNLYNYNGNCIKSCPYNTAQDDSTRQCIQCKSNQFLILELRKCIDYLPINYYRYKDDFLLYRCNIDCSVEYTGLDIEDEKLNFCKNDNIEHRCNSMIIIDSDLKVHFTILDDISKKIIQFTQLSFTQQIETLSQLKSNILTAISVNVTEALLNMNTLNEYVKTMSEESIKKLYLKQIIAMLNQTIITHSYDKDPINYVSTLSLLIYKTQTTYEIDFDDIDIGDVLTMKLDVIDKGMPKFIISETSFNQHEWTQNDISSIIGTSISKIIEIKNSSKTKETTYDEDEFDDSEEFRMNNSLILSPSRLLLKKVIDNFSYMTSLYSQSDINVYKQISFYSVSLDKLTQSSYTHNAILISAKNCENDDKVIQQMELLTLNTKICIPYQNLTEQYPNANKVSIIQYKEYPLLNRDNYNKYNEIVPSFLSISIRDINSSIINITNLTSPIVFISKRNEDNVNCIFFNETSNHISGDNCTSTLIDKYIKCECTHLTDFSLSKYNPISLVKDIFRLFSQARIINNVTSFKLISFSNAIVLYVIGGILCIYFIVLIFAIQRDKKGSMTVILTDSDSKCCEDDEKEDELKELEQKVRKKLNVNDPANNSTKLSFDKDSSQRQIAKDDEKNIQIKENEITFCKASYVLFKAFFIKEYWLCTFINNENDISKTNVLTIFVIHLIASLSVCSIFTECSNEEDTSLYTNRDLAVSICTILVLEIPFTVFEVLLQKSKVVYQQVNHKDVIIRRTKFRFAIVYFVFIVMTIFGTVNTLWISLDSINNQLECNFIKDFFMATVFDCFIYQVVILMMKTIIYFILIRSKRTSCIRAILFCIVSSLPWIFNLGG